MHEVPVTSITNGVHTKTWMSPEFSALYRKHLGDWEEHLTEPDFWRRVIDIPDTQLWETHQKLKLRLIEFVRQRVRMRRERIGDSPEAIPTRLARGEPADVVIMDGPDSTPRKARINQVLNFKGLERVLVDEAVAGDIVLITSLEGVQIGDTVASADERCSFSCSSWPEPRWS